MSIHLKVCTLLSCSQAEDGVGGFMGIECNEPLFCPCLDLPQGFLDPHSGRCHVLLRAPDDKIVCIYGTVDPCRDVAKDVIYEYVEECWRELRLVGHLPSWSSVYYDVFGFGPELFCLLGIG